MNGPTESSRAEVPQQELWNMDTFVAAYNRIADEHSGWHYQENSTTDSLQLEYEKYPSLYPSLEAFALATFNIEQRY